MADRRVVQIVLTKDAEDLINLVLDITKTKVSTLGRKLLLDWTLSILNKPGTVRGGRCGYRPGGLESEPCGASPATHYMTTWRAFVCAGCVPRINRGLEAAPIAILATDMHQPAIDLPKLRAEAQRLVEERAAEDAAKSYDDLLAELIDVSRRFGRAPQPESGFSAFAERFRSSE